MNVLNIDEMLNTLPENIRLPMSHVMQTLYAKLDGLPETFECSDLYEHDEWEALDKGYRLSLGQYLSRISVLHGSPIERVGYTSARHNRYRKK